MKSLYSLPACFLPNISPFFPLRWLFDVLEATAIKENVLGHRNNNQHRLSWF